MKKIKVEIQVIGTEMTIVYGKKHLKDIKEEKMEKKRKLKVVLNQNKRKKHLVRKVLLNLKLMKKENLLKIEEKK